MNLHSKKTALIAMIISAVLLVVYRTMELSGFAPEFFELKPVVYGGTALIIIFGISCYRYFERHPPAAH